MPTTGDRKTNVGVRRLMLRGPREAGIDLVAPSDLQAIYRAASLAANACRSRSSWAPSGRLLRGDDAPSCRRTRPHRRRCAASGCGRKMHHQRHCDSGRCRMGARRYLGEKAIVEPEGPYGEFLGYYGGVKTIRSSMSPPLPAARTRCSRPHDRRRPIAAPTPPSSPRCARKC